MLPVKKPPAPLLGAGPTHLWEVQKMIPYIASKKDDEVKAPLAEDAKQEGDA